MDLRLVRRALVAVLLAVAAAPATAAADRWSVPADADPSAAPAPAPDGFVDAALTGTGDVLAAWLSADDVVTGWASPAGRAWASAGPGRAEPRVATGPGGAGVVAWRAPDRTVLLVRDVTDPGRPVTVAGQFASTPQLAMAADGTVVAAWSEGSALLVAVRRPGRADVDPPVVVTREGHPVPQSVAAADGGRAVVAWSAGEPDTELLAARVAPDGSVSAPALLSRAWAAGWVGAGVDAAGGAVVAWPERIPGQAPAGIRAAVTAGGGWATVTGLDGAGGTAMHPGRPGLAVGPAGHVVLAWAATDPSGPGYGTALGLRIAVGTTAGAAFTTEVQDREHPGGNAIAADVAPDGSALVAQSSYAPTASWRRAGTAVFGPAEPVDCDTDHRIQVRDVDVASVTVLLRAPSGTLQRATRGPDGAPGVRCGQPVPAGGGGPLPPGSGPATVGVPTATGAAVAPTTVAAVAGQRLPTVLRRGLRLAVRHPAGGRLRVDLVLTGREARRLGLGRRARVLGARTVVLAPGATPVVRVPVAAPRRVRRALRAARRLTLQARVRAGRTTVARQTVALRR